MTEEGEEADLLGGGRKPSRRERFRDRLLKKADKSDKPKAKGVGHDEDLDDFLLKSPGEGGDALPPFPSPSRKPTPRINGSLSPRWPEAQDVTAGEGIHRPVEDQEETAPYLPSKPKRRDGLTVSFTKTAPQIIGEGGDEAEAPTISISQTRQSRSAHTFSHDGHPQSDRVSAATVAKTTPDANSTAIDPTEEQFQPRILVRAPTGLGEARTGQGTVAAAKSMMDAEFELTVPGGNMAQITIQSHPGLQPSAAAGLQRRMLEEEARALTSRLRDPSPEPSIQQQRVTPPTNAQENFPAASIPSHAQREHSPSARYNLLSPQSQPPSPSRPSSSSSYGSVTALSSTERLLEPGQDSTHGGPSARLSPRRKPLPKSPAPESKEDGLSEFRSRVRRYYGLFVLAAENTQPGLHAPLSRWIRAAAWWFLTAETSFKLLRKDLEEGVNVLQITASRRHMQAVVDLAKTAWILEVIVRDYAKAEALNLSTPESIDILIQNSPLSRFSRTLQYWQDLSKRFGSLVAAVRRNGFMTSTSENQPLCPGIDSTIWLTYPIPDPEIANWLSSANPLWVQMDETMTPVEPFDLAKAVPLKSTANTFRMRSMFCQTSGGFQHRDRTPKVPCILTIARRRGSYALVLFVVSQDHGINVVLEIDAVRGDGIEWQPTVFSALFNFADEFQFLVQLQQADYIHLKESYDLAKRASIGTVQDALENANLRETLIFRATSKTFERRSTEKIHSFPYEGEQRGCEILLLIKSEKLRGTSTTRRVHRGFRLSVMLSPHAANLSILDVHLGGDKPILLHPSPEFNPPLVELMDSRRASLLIQFPRNRDFNRFYELLTSLSHSDNEGNPPENVPLRSFSVEPSPGKARTFFSGAPWRNVQITTEQGQSHQPSHSTNMVKSESLNISVFSTHGVFADRLPQGRSQVYMSLSAADPTSLSLRHTPQQDMSVALRFKAAGTNAPTIAEQLLTQSKTNPSTWKYTFATPDDLHTFQKRLTDSDVLFDGTASSFLVSRGNGLRTKKEDFGVTRLQLLHDAHKQLWQVLAYFEEGGQAMNFTLDANDVFERSNGKGRFSIRLVEVKVSVPAAAVAAAADAGDDDFSEKKAFLCVENVDEGSERDDIVLSFEAEESRDRLAAVLPSAVKKASSLMGGLRLR